MIDLYCERLDSTLWSESINAATNLSFIIAALVLWRQATRCASLTAGIGLLTGLMVAMGIGCGLFHTFATGWAQLLDILPILLFQLACLVVYGLLMNLPTSRGRHQ
ncbi:MAG: ceramidase domain-containing protein [Gammaproteobacteria bacterium]